MRNNQEKVKTNDLMPGMYVAKLDRPWIDTPFPIQGFYIRDVMEIAALRNYCEHVFIDVELGKAPGFAEPHSPRGSKKSKSRVKASSGKIYVIEKPRALRFKPVRYEKTTELGKEVMRAVHLHKTIGVMLTQVFTKVRTNSEFNYRHVRGAAKAVANSLIRNPDAMMWMLRLKDIDSYTYHHSIRSSILAGAFGRHLGLPQNELEKLIQGCLLADIGKTRLPRELLKKPGKLADDELKLAQEHTLYGWEILEKIPGIDSEVLSIVQLHHECHDGKGYPFGLQGAEIPLLVQIASIVDYYDAITSPRVYAVEVSTTEAVSLMYEQRGKRFQEQLVENFIQAIGIYPSGTLVELSSEEVGIVIEQNKSRRLKPVVMVLLDKRHQKQKVPKVVDLMAMEETSAALSINRSLRPGTYGLYPGQIQVKGELARAS